VPARLDATRETSDEALLAACLRGDQLAWNELIDRYAALMYSIPLKYGLGEADAADVFQSVCVTLLEKLGSIRAPRGLAAWIITTTSRQCLAVARQRQRDHEHSRPIGAVAAEVGPMDPDPLPEEELLVLERHHVVRRAVAQLPDTCRRLVEALFSDESEQTSYQRLADGLGVPMNSLGPTRARCLEKLRRLLVAAGYVP
jgi:RNA polymerase sigma factor (sigma-70 family)